jgi:glycosyltransferase involved in cell wall biosynthesis
MKVYLGSGAVGAGGMTRVYEGLFEWLPKLGVEIVDSIQEADVVHAHISVWEDIPVDKPLVVSSHGLLWSNIWGDGVWNTNQQLFRSYHQADVVTAPSQFVADAISRNMLIPVKVVRHGIDPEKWTPGKQQGYVLWNKARVDAANDPRDVNELAKLAPDIQFVTTYGIQAPNVKVIGQVKPEEMLELVQGAAVYLDTAVESGGPCFGVLEAMACGVPVLAWNEGGNAEIIQHQKTGYLAHPNDFSDLLVGLGDVISRREFYAKNGLNLIKTKYTQEMTCKAYVEAYRQAIAQHNHAVKVSVIVPTYNLAKYLPACLDSIKEQTFTNWEAIVINDASPDNSLEIAEAYAKSDSRIRILNNKQNVHVSESRNRGVLASKGKYILPLDADDRLLPTSLEHLVAKLDSDRSVDIVTGTLLLYNDGYFEGEGLGYNGWPNTASYQQQIDGQNRLP